MVLAFFLLHLSGCSCSSSAMPVNQSLYNEMVLLGHEILYTPGNKYIYGCPSLKLGIFTVHFICCNRCSRYTISRIIMYYTSSVVIFDRKKLL